MAHGPQFQEAVHGFAQKEIAPRAADIDRNNAFPLVSVVSFSSSCGVRSQLMCLFVAVVGFMAEVWRYGPARCVEEFI